MEGSTEYHVSGAKNGASDGVEILMGSPFESVKDRARNVVDLDLADRLEVRDASQTPVFYYRRVFRPACATRKHKPEGITGIDHAVAFCTASMALARWSFHIASAARFSGFQSWR